MELEQGDLILCTVDRILGTTVFVTFEESGTKQEGTIVTSEIAPGRIRNLRDYVVPKKKIVCKILSINPNGNVQLSLRRVTQKEKKELLEKNKQEKSYEMILKSILGEKAKETIEKIKEENSIYEFLEEAKQNQTTLEKIVGKENTQKIIEIINSQKGKTAKIKKEITLATFEPNGLEIIKEILGEIKEGEIKYIAGGKYSLSVESESLKKADGKIKEILAEIEKQSKKKNINFGVK